MFKLFFSCLLIISSAFSTITQTDDLKDVVPLADSDTVVFFNMDDTLNDSTLSLGSGAWRQYIRKKIPEYEQKNGSRWNGIDLHDALTFYVANKVPFKPVQSDTLAIINELQSKGIPVFVLTGRGKSLWYSTEIQGVDILTFCHLARSGYNFNKLVPHGFNRINPQFYAKGVFFSTGMDKGEFLENEVFKPAHFYPKKVVFVDDKLNGLESVQATMDKLGMKEFRGVHYTRAKKEHKDFDPVVATIQLQRLLEGRVVSDAEAGEIKSKLSATDADDYFFKFLDTLDVNKINMRR